METYELTEVEVAGLPRTFILESDSIDALLVSPGRRLLGGARQQKAYESTLTWLRAMREAGVMVEDPSQICTVTVLAEGIGHNLPGAITAVLSGKPHRGDNWIGVSRFALEKKSGDEYVPFDAKVTYFRIHSNAPVWCMLDTVATGATLLRALDSAFGGATPPEKILLATPAGSAVGMKKIADFCASRDVEVVLCFFGAIFGLGEDGTALPWCHPDTITSGTERSKRNLEHARKIFNNLPGFCAVGDCSANFFDVAEAKAVLEEEENRLGWTLPCHE